MSDIFNPNRHLPHPPTSERCSDFQKSSVIVDRPLGSKSTVGALPCVLSASLPFRLSYFKRPLRRSLARANRRPWKVFEEGFNSALSWLKMFEFFWPTSASQITMRGLDRFKSTRSSLPSQWRSWSGSWCGVGGGGGGVGACPRKIFRFSSPKQWVFWRFKCFSILCKNTLQTRKNAAWWKITEK